MAAAPLQSDLNTPKPAGAQNQENRGSRGTQHPSADSAARYFRISLNTGLERALSRMLSFVYMAIELPDGRPSVKTGDAFSIGRRESDVDSDSVRRAVFGVLPIIALVLGYQEVSMSQAKRMSGVKNVVLVHGGFVDGSGWQGVYDLLKKDGYNVSIVQNPTISLADDVAVTKRTLAAQNGPAILVGHSYGGVVITEAGNDPKVAGLVYIAAFAPDKGESVSALIKNPPPGAPVPPILPPQDGYPVSRSDEVPSVVRRGRER